MLSFEIILQSHIYFKNSGGKIQGGKSGEFITRNTSKQQKRYDNQQFSLLIKAGVHDIILLHHAYHIKN